MLKKILLVLLLFTTPVYLQNLFFQNLSYINDFQFIKSVDSLHLIIGTTGGMILLDPEQNGYQVYNYSQGFPSNRISCASPYGENELILGTEEGHLILFDLNQNMAITGNSDLSGEKIIDIKSVSDTLWVATTGMIAVFTLTENQIRFIDSFLNFPDGDPRFLKILLTDSLIYAASNDGLLYAPNDIQTFNLKVESIWKWIKDSTGTIVSGIRDVLTANSLIYVLSDSGVYVLKNENTSIQFLQTVSADAFLWNQKLYFLKDNKIFNSEEEWVFPRTLKSFTLYQDGFAAIDGGNWVYMVSSARLDSLRLFSFPMKKAGTIIKTSNGNYYTNGSPPPFYVDNGLVSWNQNEIKHFYWFGSPWFNRTRFVKEILPGVILTGTWGAGFWIYDENRHVVKSMNNFDSTAAFSLTITTYKDDDSVLTEVIPKDQIETLPSVLSNGIGFENQNLVFIADALMDSIHGYLWILQYIPGNSKNLVGFPLLGNSIDFSPENALQITIPNVSQNAIYSMTMDLWGGIWLGTPFNGLIYFDYDAYMEGKSYTTRFMEADGLASNNVLSLATDNDGYVLIGTAAGTNVWTGSQLLKLREDYQPIGLQIHSIYVDRLGNRWFATNAGFSLLKQGALPWESEGWFHFTSFSSSVMKPNQVRTNIPSGEFYGIFVDYDRQKIYVSTDDGLFLSDHFPGLASESAKVELKVFPNPAIVNGNQVAIKIKNVLPNSVIKILTVNGKLVRELNPTDNNEFTAYWAVWDGKDEAGNRVPTGVYIVYGISENGESQIGKVFLIQK